MKINRIPWLSEPVEVLSKRPHDGGRLGCDIQIQYWYKRYGDSRCAGCASERCPICGSEAEIRDEIGDVRCCLMDEIGLDHTYYKYPCGSYVAILYDGTIAAAYVSDTCYGIMSITSTQEDIV